MRAFDRLATRIRAAVQTIVQLVSFQSTMFIIENAWTALSIAGGLWCAVFVLHSLEESLLARQKREGTAGVVLLEILNTIAGACVVSLSACASWLFNYLSPPGSWDGSPGSEALAVDRLVNILLAIGVGAACAIVLHALTFAYREPSQPSHIVSPTLTHVLHETSVSSADHHHGA